MNIQYREALKDIQGEYSKYSSNNKDITLSVCFVSSPAFLRFISRSNPVEYSSPVNENGIRVTRMARDALNQKQQRDVRSFSIRFKAPYFRYRSRLCRSDYIADSCVFSSRVNDARRDNENHCSNSEAGDSFGKNKSPTHRHPKNDPTT